MRILIATILAALQAVLLAGSIYLHSPVDHTREHGLQIADLPAYLHHHNYQFGAGNEATPILHTDCLGCRLERTPSVMAVPPRLEAPIAVALFSFGHETSLSFAPLTLRLPRAPPIA